jgi:hypothetical protein
MVYQSKHLTVFVAAKVALRNQNTENTVSSLNLEAYKDVATYKAKRSTIKSSKSSKKRTSTKK